MLLIILSLTNPALMRYSSLMLTSDGGTAYIILFHAHSLTYRSWRVCRWRKFKLCAYKRASHEIMFRRVSQTQSKTGSLGAVSPPSLCLFSGRKFIWSLRGLVRLRAAIGVSTLRPDPPKRAHTTFSISAP
jgi:hypothetical protein